MASEFGSSSLVQRNGQRRQQGGGGEPGASFWGFKQRQDLVRCMFSLEPCLLAGELLGTGWKKNWLSPLSFSPRLPSLPLLEARDFLKAASASGTFTMGRSPAGVANRHWPKVWCTVRSRGRVTRSLASGVRIKGPVPAPPLWSGTEGWPQGCQGRAHTQSPGSFSHFSDLTSGSRTRVCQGLTWDTAVSRGGHWTLEVSEGK